MLLLLALARGAVAEDPGADPERCLRRASRTDLPLAERIAAGRAALAAKGPLPAEAAVRAGLSVLVEDPETGASLVKRGIDDGWVDPDARATAAAKVSAVENGGDAPKGAGPVLAALRLVLGDRSDGTTEALLEAWPPSPFVAAVIEAECPAPRDSREAVRSSMLALLPAARLLDRAAEDDPATSLPALDALRALGKDALPLLLHETERAAKGVPEGRIGRATRAVAVLGAIRDRTATPALVRALTAPSGWVRVAAATALGDVGDPAAAVALARQLVYAGDDFRTRDQWDYPGTTETPIPPDQWQTVEYYAIDGAAADALLRSGFPGAAGWLVHNKLDPRKANFRIRVLQDAVDTLRRSASDAPWAAYNVDAGLPQRHEAFEALVAWWRKAGAMKPAGAPPEAVESDPGFRETAKGVAAAVTGARVLEKMIAGDTCVLLGRALTPTLVEALDATKGRVAKAELAKALRLVRDRRAVPPLLALRTEKAGFVRAAAAEGLGPYVADGAAPVLDALLAFLDDAEAGPPLAAMLALAYAPPSKRVLDAVHARSSAWYAEKFGPDPNYERAERVVLLIQEGEEHWPAIRAGLDDAVRVVRRTWWDLLRAALDLSPHLFDPDPAPGDRGRRAIDEDAVRNALRARRGA
jgi:HEAT repeat protein